ncbi:MAG: MBL fold metallo-hydrolase [Lachnospiraceae bacterium]|nr:MBL fold metallo-hydrolase [Lachnospiraceae bacterium]
MWWLDTLKEEVNTYWGTGAFGLLFLGAFLFFFLKKEKSREMKVYLWYGAILMFLIGNPIFLTIVSKAKMMKVFERFFWLLLSPVCIALAFVRMSEKKKWMWLPCLLLIVLCGNTVYTSIEYKPAENVYKISEEAIEISEIILRDYEKLPKDAKIVPNRKDFKGPKAIVAEPVAEDIRMYNANIQLLFVRKSFGNYKTVKRIAGQMLMSNDVVNMKRIVRKMKKDNYSYVVFAAHHILPENMEDYPIYPIGQTEHYTVYKLEEQPAESYTITQFADVEGLQCLSYLIEDGRGGLAVVDGGRAWQSVSLVEEIKKRGGGVDYWIITHPHDDHCGVLCSILEAGWDKTEISIGQILIGEMDYEAVKKQGIRVDTYSYLLRGLEGHENVTWLKAGDVKNVLGLKMEVFHSCDELVITKSDNILNDGSMVFKLSGKEESILYLADVGELVADEIMVEYGDKLDADYVQMSHHGNGSLPDSFYELVSPKTALFDAPDWLMENRNRETGEESYYTTPHYIELMTRMGVDIVSYDTAPNEITLH